MPFLEFLKKLFNVQDTPRIVDRTPVYWNSVEGEIIRAIILDGNQSWTRLQQHTGFDQGQLNYNLSKLMREGVINKSNRYWVQPEIADRYRQFYQEIYTRNNPLGKDLSFLDDTIPQQEKSIFIESLRGSSIRGVKKLLSNKQLFVDGRPLGLVTRDLIYAAKKEVLIVNPFVMDCALTESIVKASAYKKTFLLTRPPEFETDFKFYEKTQCHNTLKESGVRIAYNPDVHAKVAVFDRALCIVSSMNLYHDSSEGFTYEAGMLTIDEEVVNYIIESLRTVLKDERTGTLF